MKKLFATGVAVTLLTVLGTLFWQAVRLREPACQGRSLSLWLKEYDGLLTKRVSETERQRRTDCEHALHNIGTNAIPFLMTKLRAQDSSLWSRLAMLTKHPRWPLGHFTTAADHRRQAAAGFRALGQKGKPAVPELSELLNHPFSWKWSMNILISFDDATALPALTRAVTNSNPEIRRMALLDLGYRRSSARGVIRLFAGSLTDPDGGVREAAAFALARFPGEPDLAVPALMQALQDPDSSVQSTAAQSLGEFGEKALLAVPALEKLVQLHGSFSTAAGALRRIDPVAAARAGITPLPALPSFE